MSINPITNRISIQAYINLFFATLISIHALLLYVPLMTLSFKFVIEELKHYYHWQKNHFQVTVYPNPEHKTTQISPPFSALRASGLNLRKVNCDSNNNKTS